MDKSAVMHARVVSRSKKCIAGVREEENKRGQVRYSRMAFFFVKTWRFGLGPIIPAKPLPNRGRSGRADVACDIYAHP